MLGLVGVTLVPGVAYATTAGDVGACAATPIGTVINANPSNYRALLSSLSAGQRMRLAPGTYPDGLRFDGHNGSADNCIIVEGPDVWPPTAVFTDRDCCNTVSIRDSSYLVIRNLEIDGTGMTDSIDGVKAESDSTFAHHITLENLFIHDHDFSQQTVCISTKVPAWNWVIRNNVLDTCGTGAYLGDSSGEDEFVAGLIERNLIVNAIGYDMQIKHQNGRATGLGSPADAVTIIRHNVMSKGSNSSGGTDARPNLLVGAWPSAGPGSDDDYLIYGNFLYRNPTGFEALFQGEGNVILYDNLLVNPVGPGVYFQNNNGPPRRLRVFQNTVVASSDGIAVFGADTSNYEQWLRGNAVFATDPLTGGTQVSENVTDTQANASAYVTNPTGAPGVDLDLFPLANGTLQGAVNTLGLTGYEDADLDFNSNARDVSSRGAYAGQGTNPGWMLALERKPVPVSIFADGFESGDTGAWSNSTP
jgi:hypothetical protein